MASDPEAPEPVERAVEVDDSLGGRDADDRRTARRRRRRRWRRVRRWGRRLLMVALSLVALGCFGLWGVLSYYERDLPSVAELQRYHPPQTTRVLARDESLLAELFIERRTVVPIERIPAAMKLAVLAAEDADFYEHAGLDYVGMLRALYVNLRSGAARQGGSTITQQVVKNVLLTPERTFARKAREVLLARRIEQSLSKDEILELYLNHIYFGHGRYGVEEASRYYFGKGVEALSLAEAALLAGLAKAPNVYSPRVDRERARKRRNYVLGQLALKGFASAAQCEEAAESPILLAPEVDAMAELAPEVIEEVRRTLRALVGSAAASGGYTVITTIDPHLQAAARQALRANLDRYAERHGLVGPFDDERPVGPRPGGGPPEPFRGVPKAHGHHVYWAVVLGADDAGGTLAIRVGQVEGTVRLADGSRYNPRGLAPSRFAEPGTLLRVSPITDRGLDDEGVPRQYRLELGPQGALVALDVHRRDILALVGSYEAIRGGLDRATFARRQPGSTFKPIVYGYGIHTGELTAATAIPSEEEIQRAQGDAGTAERPVPTVAPTLPTEPPLRLREALARSVNRAALWAIDRLGAKRVVEFAHALGVRSELGATASLALGAYEVSPRELAEVYGTFAAGGVHQRPRLIRSIEGPNGQPIALAERQPARRVLAEAEAYVLTSLLTSVVQEGTGRRARALERSIAGKTGTSNDARDAWFAGYSSDIVCVVWTGYDDAVSLGARETGAKAALPAFVDFMRVAHRDREPRRFPVPDGVVRVAIDPRTALLAYEGQEDSEFEVFVAGTEPADVAERPDAGVDAGVDAGAAAGPPSLYDVIDRPPEPPAVRRDTSPGGGTSATASAGGNGPLR